MTTTTIILLLELTYPSLVFGLVILVAQLCLLRPVDKGGRGDTDAGKSNLGGGGGRMMEMLLRI